MAQDHEKVLIESSADLRVWLEDNYDTAESVWKVGMLARQTAG